jgi:hypothetical protein
MIQNFKILGQSAPTSSTDTSIYTTPGNTSTVVKSINITNRSSTSDTYSISLGNSEKVLILTGYNLTGKTALNYSTNGIDWTSVSTDINTNNTVFVYGNGKWVAVNNGQVSYTSTNLTNWTYATTIVSSSYTIYTGFAYGNGKFVNIVDSGLAYYSTDGITWTLTSFPSRDIQRLLYLNNFFIANTYNPTVHYSTDGITWNTATMPSGLLFGPGYLTEIAYGNGVYIGVGGQNPVNYALYSTDVATWTKTTLPTSQQWSTVAYGNGLFVVTARNTSTYITSSNGSTWTIRTLPSSPDLLRSIYINNNFILINNNGDLLYSTDGINWTTKTSAIPNIFYTFGLYAHLTSSMFPATNTDKNFIFKNNTIDGNSTISLKSGYTLPEYSSINVKSTNGTSTFSAYGVELT